MKKDTNACYLDLERYSRQLALPEVGVEGQMRLQNSHVLFIGAGGLSAPALLYLAASGIGQLSIVDPDRVELSNLQRQVLYTENDCGHSKVAAAKNRLLALNSTINIITHECYFSETNALELVQAADLVIDGSDNFATRYLANDACFALQKPYIYASVLRLQAQCAVFSGNEGPCYRCLYPAPPADDVTDNCVEGGVLGVLPGIMGLLQATQALNLILGINPKSHAKLITFDAATLHFHEFSIAADPECKLCAKHYSFNELTRPTLSCVSVNNALTQSLLNHSSVNTGEITMEISVANLKAKLELELDKIQLIDVREPHEYADGHLNAKLIPLGEIPHNLHEFDAEKEIILYCRSGRRSSSAVLILRGYGFTNVKSLSGGILAWDSSE